MILTPLMWKQVLNLEIFLDLWFWWLWGMPGAASLRTKALSFSSVVAVDQYFFTAAFFELFGEAAEV